MVLETELCIEFLTCHIAIGIDGIIATSTARCIGSYGVPGLNPARFSHSPIHLSSINFATQTVFMLALCVKG